MEHHITVKDILNITNGKLIGDNLEYSCQNFSKDTRDIQQNDIYIGIKGENFDGNTLYQEAFEKGAIGCILQTMENIEVPKGKFVICVKDSIKALQQIASYKRSLYNIPVIAITGSVGKTSTKDLVASVMSKKYKVLKTQGNLNNHIGLPITLLKLKDHEAIVVEMGMNNFGEIQLLTNIAKPTVAIITNVGTSHIGILGSRENILKAKLEILEGLDEKGTIIINHDNDLLQKWYQSNEEKRNILTYGIETQSKVMAKDITYFAEGSHYTAYIEKECIGTIDVPVGGSHFVYNSLCALTVGNLFDIAKEEIQTGITNFELSKKRMDIQKVKGYTVINDCYNANYDSMKAAIDYLGSLSATRKIAILGDMLELGEYAKDFHQKVGYEVARNKVDILITVGNLSKDIAKQAAKNGVSCIMSFEKNEEAIEQIKSIIKQGDVILIKASHSMKFDEITESIL